MSCDMVGSSRPLLQFRSDPIEYGFGPAIDLVVPESQDGETELAEPCVAATVGFHSALGSA